MENPEDYKEVSERYHNNYVNPHLSAAFRMIENGYLAFSSPDDRAWLESKVDELQSTLLSYKKRTSLVVKKLK